MERHPMVDASLFMPLGLRRFPFGGNAQMYEIFRAIQQVETTR
jgi:hypothetical protein